jgi:adenine-specific DNA-methyltransferase
MTNSEQAQENNPLDAIATTDGNAERLATLKSLYPDLFTSEGKLNITELQKLADPNSVNETERFEFKWFGKSQAKRNAFAPTNATLVFDASRSVNPQSSQHIIIEGENLEVLKLLKEGYREKIKCIYIDPPYNTGKDFVYSDNFTQDKKAYWQDNGTVVAGIKVDTNSESDGRYHSHWLNMIFSRLLLARELLRDDGVIFISIDDNEVHHLRKLCDEVFGESNFVANVVWQKKYAATNDAKGFSTTHDHIMVYQKSEIFERNLLPRTEELNKPYKNDDNDGRGLWRSGDLLVKSYSASSIYPIINPNTAIEYYPADGSSWRASEETMQKWLSENRIYWGKDGTGAPQLKRYLNEVQDGRVPITWWPFDEVGSNDTASKELKSLFDTKPPFDTPKPVDLLKRILQIATDEYSVVLDFFGGSGTTGHAVMELNKADGGNRQFILVQIPEQTDEASEAYKAGYKKISDITIARNQKVAAKLQAEGSETGFKVFKLAMSNFPRVMFELDPNLDEAGNLQRLQQYINEKNVNYLIPLMRRVY